jgi:hypothetical protein
LTISAKDARTGNNMHMPVAVMKFLRVVLVLVVVGWPRAGACSCGG